MRRRLFTVQRVKRRAIHQVNIEPAVVVVVDQANTRAVRLHDELLLRHAHLVDPTRQARSLGDVLEDHRAAVNEFACRDRPLLRVILRRRLQPPTQYRCSSLAWRAATVLVGMVEEGWLVPVNSCFCSQPMQQILHN